jgi:hypothetical protein
MIKRVGFSLLMLFSILFLPFWISVVLAILGMFYFSNYYEAVLLFFVSDILFGVKEARFFDIVLISALASFLALLFIEYLKKKLKFYKER